MTGNETPNFLAGALSLGGSKTATLAQLGESSKVPASGAWTWTLIGCPVSWLA
jgi:hypothetical protein